MSLDHVVKDLNGNEVEADYTCYKCGLSFTRGKDYFPCETTTLDQVLCYCCANDTHYVILSDINKNDMEDTEEGFYTHDTRCRYCDKKLSLEFKFVDNAVMDDNHNDTTSVEFGDAD